MLGTLLGSRDTVMNIENSLSLVALHTNGGGS